jgi:lipopolysaccharide/colanic/teichoic acid biosynthesis glycosyltransferase
MPRHAHGIEPDADARSPQVQVVLAAPIVVRNTSSAARVMARVRDIVIGALLLLLTLPLIGLLAVAISIDSPGGPLFAQARLGRDAKQFRFYKFRTMWVDARDRFPEMYAYSYTKDEISGLRFKVVNDPRLTRMGRWLRRTSLDELPNLWNVLRGDMSLVGPRPEIPQMLPYYRDDQLAKFAVKPGLTGMAQVHGRNIIPFQETIGHDLRYVAARSLVLDVHILLRTVWVVVWQWGAL